MLLQWRVWRYGRRRRAVGVIELSLVEVWVVVTAEVISNVGMERGDGFRGQDSLMHHGRSKV